MSRRRLSKATRWTLYPGLATGTAALIYGHDLSWGAGACLATWAGIIVARLLSRHKPHRRTRPRRDPSPGWAALEASPHVVYHALGWRGDLRYVGIACDTDTRDVRDRIDEHWANQRWWRHEVARTYVVARYATRNAAEAREAYDIHTLHPPRNRTHKTHGLHACPTVARARDYHLQEIAA